MAKHRSIPGEFPLKQIKILKILYEKPYRQNALSEILNISPPAVLYHLDILSAKKLIIKKTLAQIGNARINEISIPPLALQRVRSILGFKEVPYMLVTGFNKFKTEYRLPDILCTLLDTQGILVTGIVCFANLEAKHVRDQMQGVESLKHVDEYFTFPLSDFSNHESAFFSRIETILEEKMRTSDLILDLTPLTKAFSFKMVEIAQQYQLPCFYLAQDAQERYFLKWMSQQRGSDVI